MGADEALGMCAMIYVNIISSHWHNNPWGSLSVKAGMVERTSFPNDSLADFFIYFILYFKMESC